MHSAHCGQEDLRAFMGACETYGRSRGRKTITVPIYAKYFSGLNNFSTLGTDKAFFEDLPLVREGMHFSVVIPMVVDGKPIGTFNVNRRHEQELSSAELDLLTRVSNQIAIAVTNSRRFDNIRRQKEGLRRENAYLLELTRAEPATNLLLIRPSMQSWLDRLMTIAKVDATVLIGSETGTGKGILARVLHDWS